MTDEFIFNCNQLIDSNIIITCNKPWSQDDLEELVAYFLNQFDQFKLIERIQGADRELIRIVWQERYFNMHIECYSESIWLTAEDQYAEQALADVVRYLKVNS